MSTIQQDINQIAQETAISGNTKTRVAAILERIYNEPKPLEVVTNYPTTTPLKAGQKFLYKGNEWHYMTQDEIDSTGWTGLVSVGFPAPVRKVLDYPLFLTGITFRRNQNRLLENPGNAIMDFLGLGNPINVRCIIGNDVATYIGFRNANLLGSLEDEGTFYAIQQFTYKGMTTDTINGLFTQLPVTTKAVTIDISNNPGSATCNPSIATAKGYTVIT